jgi:hypothetical protein
MKENLRQGSIILNILRSIYYLKLTDTDSVQGSADIFIFFKKHCRVWQFGSVLGFIQGYIRCRLYDALILPDVIGC